MISKTTQIGLSATFILVFLTGYLIGSLITQTKITNTATIKTIGVNVYWDVHRTQPITFIDWGILEPATNKTILIYVKSQSNTPITLTIYTENWKPQNASDYITLTAEPNNSTLQPSEIAQVNLTLTVASNIQGITTFAFDIFLEGTG